VQGALHCAAAEHANRVTFDARGQGRYVRWLLLRCAFSSSVSRSPSNRHLKPAALPNGNTPINEGLFGRIVK
jgi:hypothetical protein